MGYGTAKNEGGLVQFDLVQRKQLAMGPISLLKERVGIVAFNADAKTLAAGHSGGIFLWDVNTRKRIDADKLKMPEGTVTRLAFSFRQSIRAAGYGDYSMGGVLPPGTSPPVGRVWERPLTVPNSGRVTNVALSPDGNTLAAAYALFEMQLMLWNVDTRKPLLAEPIAVQWSAFTGLTFSPDSKTLAAAVGGARGGVMLWEARTGRPLVHEPLQVRSLHVASIAYSPDGKSIAAGGRIRAGVGTGGAIMLLDVSPSSWRTLAAQVANRNFSQKEWTEYFADKPYRRTFEHLPDGAGVVEARIAADQTDAVPPSSNSPRATSR